MKFEISGASVALDADGFANNVNSSAGEALTLAATEVGDDLAHKVIITPSGSVTGNYSLTGTGPNGQAQTETLATDTTNAVTSAKYWLTLTEVLAPAGIGAETVDIGWTAASVSPWQPLKVADEPFSVGFGCVIADSPTYSVEHTYDGATAFVHSTVSGETTNQEGTYTAPVAGIRLAWSAAGTVTLTGLQATKRG